MKLLSMTVMQAPRSPIGQGGRILIFGFLSAMAPLSIDIYLPALPMMRQALGANEAQTLFTLSSFFIGFGVGQFFRAAVRPLRPQASAAFAACWSI